MDHANLIAELRNSMAAITNPRFFETERGFQGELILQLGKRLRFVSPEIIEQEYQKRMSVHGLRIRPDIIIHEPFDPSFHTCRSDGNIAVLELKLNASVAEAIDDFNSLAEMLRVLNYPIGIFINICSKITHANLVPLEVRGRIITFATSLTEGKVHIVEQHT